MLSSVVSKIAVSKINPILKTSVSKINEQAKYFKYITNRNSLSSFEKGISAEFCAEKKLRFLGYKILGKRVKTQYGEIDILAQKEKTLIAVEVKQRKTMDYARSCISRRQMARISNALMFLASKITESIESYRVDMLCLDAVGHIEHIENAFSIENFIAC
ncbi:MAG: YraN family protein [Holosporales bacterium]|jgi:putative endonuclease|nr:YraN family protein [Holosporales bacterium]